MRNLEKYALKYAAHMLHICGITEICGVNDACACWTKEICDYMRIFA